MGSRVFAGRLRSRASLSARLTRAATSCLDTRCHRERSQPGQRTESSHWLQTERRVAPEAAVGRRNTAEHEVLTAVTMTLCHAKQ